MRNDRVTRRLSSPSPRRLVRSVALGLLISSLALLSACAGSSRGEPDTASSQKGRASVHVGVVTVQRKDLVRNTTLPETWSLSTKSRSTERWPDIFARLAAWTELAAALNTPGVSQYELEPEIELTPPTSIETETSVALTTRPDLKVLEAEIRAWAETRPSGALLFPTEKGTTWRIGNYLKRVLKPLAASVGINDLTHQCLRRTCATHFKGDVKDRQTQMRHADPSTTLKHYQKSLSDGHPAAVEAPDAEFKAAWVK